MARMNAGDHERSAAGMDFDSPLRERANSFGSTLAESGPEALFEEIENLIPDNIKEQIRSFPLAAVLIGVGVGVFLGLKKADEIIAAGSSLISAAAMANVGKVMQRNAGDADSDGDES